MIAVRVLVVVMMVLAGLIGETGVCAESGILDQVRDLLELHGIDRSQLQRFADGEPIRPEEEETVLRLLQRFPRLPREKLEQWSAPHSNCKAIAGTPAENRGGVFRLRGALKKVDRLAVPEELSKRLDFQSYFRATIQLQETPQDVVVYTRFVPRAWESASGTNEPSGAIGIFLKLAPGTDNHPELVFCAERMEWFPKQVSEQLGVSAPQVYLASLGFDIGLLDLARAENRKPLSVADRECFYQMLAAVARCRPQQFIANAQQSLEIISLLNDPDHRYGELMKVEGIARRVIRVRVDDADIHQRFGIRDYFQIDLFVDLDKKVIALEKREEGVRTPIYENSYPVTVCVPSLPPGLPEGDVMRENIRVHAAFFKLWSYPSDYVTSFDKKLLQVSPMLLGVEPQLVKLPTFDPGFGIGLAVVIIVSSIGLWIGLRRPGQSTIQATYFPPTGESSPDESASPLPDRPDFSGLESK